MKSDMHRLILLRHAKAEPAGGTDDHGRRLVDEGLAAAREAGAWLAQSGADPELVICSTSARTRGTWDEVAPFFESDIGVVFDDRLYDAEPAAVLALIAETRDDVGELLVVGHNPSLEAIGAALSGDRTYRAIPTAGIQVLEFSEGGWRDIGAGGGALRAVFVPGSVGASQG